MSYLATLGYNLKKLLSFFALVPLNFSSCKDQCKSENPNLGPKMSYLRNFGLGVRKSIVIFEIIILNFFLKSKFGAKIKIIKFRTKSALFGYFFAEI